MSPGLVSSPLGFLSTPSARRATCSICLHEPVRKISIHALREEGDMWTLTLWTPQRYFYPRPPRGGRHKWQYTINSLLVFLSTPSARRATLSQPVPDTSKCVFLSTPSARRATGESAAVGIPSGFLSTPSARRATSASPLLQKDKKISIHALREEGDMRHGSRCAA